MGNMGSGPKGAGGRTSLGQLAVDFPNGGEDTLIF